MSTIEKKAARPTPTDWISEGWKTNPLIAYSLTRGLNADLCFRLRFHELLEFLYLVAQDNSGLEVQIVRRFVHLAAFLLYRFFRVTVCSAVFGSKLERRSLTSLLNISADV